MVQGLLETEGVVSGQYPELTNSEADRRRAAVERLFSPLNPEQLGGLTLDELAKLSQRMHNTLMGLQPMMQRRSDVFSAIEEELGDRMKELNRTLPELGNNSPFGTLVRFAKGEYFLPTFEAPAQEDDVG